MNAGIFITVRLGSTRLKRKHFLEINVYYLLKRILTEFRTEREIGHRESRIIATSDEAENRAFEQFSVEGVTVFMGQSVTSHVGICRQLQGHNIFYIVSVDGGDILCSTRRYEACLSEKCRQRVEHRTLLLVCTPLDIRGSFWNNPFHLKNQMFWKQVEERFLMSLNCPICRWISMYRVTY